MTCKSKEGLKKLIDILLNARRVPSKGLNDKLIILLKELEE